MPVYGTIGNDFYQFGSDSDIVYGLRGNDTYYGGIGDDTLNGNQGKDRLYGDAGNDSLVGGYGDDYLVGGSGSDYLEGGSGNDTLVGDSNQLTTIIDDFAGGLGADTFAIGDSDNLYYQGDGYANIMDFNRNEGDKIQLPGSLSDYLIEPFRSGLGIYTTGDDQIAYVQKISVLVLSDFIFV